jgi:hypothetical protein
MDGRLSSVSSIECYICCLMRPRSRTSSSIQRAHSPRTSLILSSALLLAKQGRRRTRASVPKMGEPAPWLRVTKQGMHAVAALSCICVAPALPFGVAWRPACMVAGRPAGSTHGLSRCRIGRPPTRAAAAGGRAGRGDRRGRACAGAGRPAGAYNE